MAEFFLSIFTGTIIAVSLYTPRWLVGGLQDSQHQLDQSFITGEACRSSAGNIVSQRYRFSAGEPVACPLERLDFGAPNSRGSTPAALCTLLDAAELPTQSGEFQCDYQ